jgi:hypothetical protein
MPAVQSLPVQQAIIPYQGRPTDDVAKIMKQIVADTSKDTYDNQNVPCGIVVI